MAKYIKSHSNYVLKSKHQLINDGTVWERDITTIGGVNQFSPGQRPIYRSGNFIITVRNDNKVSNQYNSTKWKENEDTGTIWTLESAENAMSDDIRQDDTRIVLKQDYYDLRDFAYYGSLTELFRASVTDIIERFPGELYSTPSGEVYYTSAVTVDFERIESSIRLGDDSQNTYVSNPFGINLFSPTRPSDGEVLKYFADGGYSNYVLFSGDDYDDTDSGYTIDYWESRAFTTVVKKKEVLDAEFGDEPFYQEYMSEKIETIASQPDREIRWTERKDKDSSDEHVTSGYSIDCSGNVLDYDTGWDELNACFDGGEIYSAWTEYYNTRFHVFDGNGTDLTTGTTGFSSKTEAYEYIATLDSGETYSVHEFHPCGDITCYLHVTPCKGDKAGSITARTANGNEIVIGVWIGDDNTPYYLTDSSHGNYHIRPKKKFTDIFYNGCDNFEYMLMNPKSTPLYKTIFSVIRENDFGYYRELVPFEFPKSEGGYNIDATDYGFTTYTNRMVEIGEFYDENFSDNLYRSMTHESIKNFDWSRTREYNEDEDIEDVMAAGQKVQKALRIFAREFDEVLPFIDNIRNGYTVTYDQRNNIPDYFLTDVVGNEGWDVKLVMPYSLSEYFFLKDDEVEGNENAVINEVYTERGVEDGQLNNKETVSGETRDVVREFSQISNLSVTPYSKKYANQPELADGYFTVCGGDGSGCTGNYSRIPSSGQSILSGESYDGRVTFRDRMKNYTDEREYTYLDANNEFLRRLKINSRHIWRHKGTVDGIEMILAMFGLKSKVWYDSLSGCKKEEFSGEWDYDIEEYTSFTERIEEQWDAVHQMYRIDWINSTKDIVYDTRFISNYNPNGTYDGMIPYQGLPVSYRDSYLHTVKGDKPYLKISPLNEDFSVGQEKTENTSEAFMDINRNNESVRRRFLYPNFMNYGQFDGNPYFQMDGGWMSKRLVGDAGTFNFQYDVDNNIVYSPYILKGEYNPDTDEIRDNERLYKETIRNIRRVETVGEMLAIPSQTLSSGAICYVTRVNPDTIVVDDTAYELKHEFVTDYASQDLSGKTMSYVSFIKDGGMIRVSRSKFFDVSICVYNSDGIETTYNLEDKPDGYEVKAYVIYDGDTPRFVCKSDSESFYSIESFTILGGDSEEEYSNYFVLDNPYYSDMMSSFNGDTGEWSEGWRRLRYTERDYIKINTIHNYFYGNNGHNGNMHYDSGHEYFTYFKRLFKYALDNDKFDERCYTDFYETADDEISNIGFKDLIEDNEDILQYDDFLTPEKKIHFFGNYKKTEFSLDGNDDSSISEILIYGEDKDRVDSAYTHSYSAECGNITQYILNDAEKTLDGEDNPYIKQSGDTVDESTDQILNNKRFRITFNLHDKWYTKAGQEEVKYLDDIVMNYLEQMVPSTVIVEVVYQSGEESPCDKLEITA